MALNRRSFLATLLATVALPRALAESVPYVVDTTPGPVGITLNEASLEAALTEIRAFRDYAWFVLGDKTPQMIEWSDHEDPKDWTRGPEAEFSTAPLRAINMARDFGVGIYCTYGL